MLAFLPLIISALELVIQYEPEIHAVISLIVDLTALSKNPVVETVEADVMALFQKHGVDPNKIAAIMQQARSPASVEATLNSGTF